MSLDGCHATIFTSCACPANTDMHSNSFPGCTSQIHTCLSLLHVANSIPDAFQATLLTSFSCPWRPIRTSSKTVHKPPPFTFPAENSTQSLARWMLQNDEHNWSPNAHLQSGNAFELTAQTFPNSSRCIEAGRCQQSPARSPFTRPHCTRVHLVQHSLHRFTMHNSSTSL